MKRKLLLEFADYLERGRKPFSITNYTQCISYQACRFNGDIDKRTGRVVVDGVARVGSERIDLMRIFDLTPEKANAVYGAGFSWDRTHDDITRKVPARP